MSEFDTLPIRLPSGTKAVVLLPLPFTPEDAEHMSKFLALYIEEAPKKIDLQRDAAQSRAQSDTTGENHG